ncbi:hypothetical protein SPRG_02196 [Saprolegnia parasitica CBS 223.65]|uniref:Uncharacterized protein n=1 Tax=Saprolegnia parasitica (strain CBS 223.65) TaxID=695850 RepID=A0A067CRQ0_SAPPC|nr:hypothetical protein SPRG_02196 [Saprolegnia parasitica CBS 223.65]KDO33389.1 hypothetical protein SPRG_02196 [Saprolegnia parasitica CBS 223.65]|eukprot:XP_012196137.1 hypothetical protein SPRG_02196 [Saprolegnia parasitica CBS 223.65]
MDAPPIRRLRGPPLSIFETRSLRIIFSFVGHPSDLFAAIRAFPVDILPIGYPSLLTMADVIGDDQVAPILPIDHPRLDAQDIARGLEVLPLLSFFSPAGIARQQVFRVPVTLDPPVVPSCLVQTTTALLCDALDVMLPPAMDIREAHVIEISGDIAIDGAAIIWTLCAFECSRRVDSLHIFNQPTFSPMATQCPETVLTAISRFISCHEATLKCIDLCYFELSHPQAGGLARSLRTSSGLRDLKIMGSLDSERRLDATLPQAAFVYGLAPTLLRLTLSPVAFADTVMSSLAMALRASRLTHLSLDHVRGSSRALHELCGDFPDTLECLTFKDVLVTTADEALPLIATARRASRLQHLHLQVTTLDDYTDLNDVLADVYRAATNARSIHVGQTIRVAELMACTATLHHLNTLSVETLDGNDATALLPLVYQHASLTKMVISGLDLAPASVQALRNHLATDYARAITIEFLDDIDDIDVDA